MDDVMGLVVDGEVVPSKRQKQFTLCYCRDGRHHSHLPSWSTEEHMHHRLARIPAENAFRPHLVWRIVVTSATVQADNNSDNRSTEPRG